MKNSHFFMGYLVNTQKDVIFDDPVHETAKETQMYRTVFWTLWEKVRVG